MTAVVVGGGIAGLVAARALALAGERVALYEAANRCGGMVSDVSLAGLRVDAGAEAYATRSGVVAQLCEELALDVAEPVGQPHLWWPDCGAVPMAAGIFGIPAAKTDPAIQVLSTTGRAELDRDDQLAPDVGAGAGSVAELVQARLGDEALDKLVRPVCQGILNTAPEQLPTAMVLPDAGAAISEHGSLLAAVAAVKSRQRAATQQPIGGMFQLVTALIADLKQHGVKIEVSTRVTSLRQVGTRWQLRAGSDDVVADRVVLTAGPASTAMLLDDDISDVPTGGGWQAILRIRDPRLDAAPVGSGLIVAQPVDDMGARALTHYSVKWPWAAETGDAVLRVSYPADLVPRRSLVLSDVSKLVGMDVSDRSIVAFESVPWPESGAKLPPEHRAHLSERFAAIPGLDVVGAWLNGNGLAAVVAAAGRIET